MNKYLYFECESGISGDMTVAALLDLGASKEVLDKVLASITDQSFEIKYSRVKKSGLDCMDFDVVLDEEHDGHDHDMDYLYGHLHESDINDTHTHVHNHHAELDDQENNGHYFHHEQNNKNDCVHEHSHEHEHNHEHGHHHVHEHNHLHVHDHVHRTYKEVMKIVNRCEMTQGAHELTEKIFSVLAEAESKAHGIPVEEVHFHEVGAIDSIVDVISIAVCLDDLGYKSAIVPYLCEGKGTVRCQHGILPIPVPAVSNIVVDYGIPVKKLDVDGELVTPTGAATIAALRGDSQLPDVYKILRVGMGAGKRDYGLSGFLRVMEIAEV